MACGNNKKMRRLKKLTGDIPVIYKASTIYTMGIVINALVDAVNYLADQVEELKGGVEDGKVD